MTMTSRQKMPFGRADRRITSMLLLPLRRRRRFACLVVATTLFAGIMRLWQRKSSGIVMPTHSEERNEIKSLKEDNNQPWDPNWWKPMVDRVARPFAVLPLPTTTSDNDALPSWCVPRPIEDKAARGNTTVNRSGIYLVKIPKTASSTAAGVTIQIARNVPRRPSADDDDLSVVECTHHVEHGMDHVDHQDPFFLWTILRHPGQRAVSHYFFELVSRRSTLVTSEGMIQELKRHVNFQFWHVARR